MNMGKKIADRIFIGIVLFIIIFTVLPENLVLYISSENGASLFSIEECVDENAETAVNKLRHNGKNNEYIVKFGTAIDPKTILICQTDAVSLHIELKSYMLPVVKMVGGTVDAFVNKAVVDENAGVSQVEFSSSFFGRLELYVKVYSIIKRIVLLLLLFVFFFFWIFIRASVDERKRNNYNSVRFICLKQIGIFILTALGVGLPYVYAYIRSHYDVDLDQLFFYLTSNLDGANWSNYLDGIVILLYMLGIVVLLNILLLLLFLLFKKNSGEEKLKSHLILASVIRYILSISAIAVIGGSTYKFLSSYRLMEYFVNRNTTSTFFEEYYINPSEIDIQFPDEKKNLIYIFLESTEITNADIEHGGAKTDNYMPDLTSLALENDNFNGGTDILNGGYTVGNTTWTIAGIVAQTAGVPMNAEKNDIDKDTYGEDAFLPGIISLGDILEKEGYHNYFMIGSEASFANRDTYFTEHGNYQIYDYNWAVEEEKIPSDYFVWWGYEDCRLFDFAKNQLLEAADHDEPFNFTMLTVDTHYTNGYFCDMCKCKYPEQYPNVLNCANDRIIEFVNWIRQQDFYEDTVIILSGDHLYPVKDYFSDISYDYDRRTYVAILNSSKKEPENKRLFSTMDLFPTTLSALGCEIEGNRLGMGVDLYSDELTLMEIMGKNKLDYQLRLKSNYYREYFMNEYIE